MTVRRGYEGLAGETSRLIAHGETVLNIMGPGRLKQALLTEGAVIRDDGTVVYPA